MCPVNLYSLYVSKLNPRCTKLWQKPRQGYIHYNDLEWYEARPVGKDPLNRFIRFLSDAAKLSPNNYTNHSIRTMCIGKLDDKGFEARHITALSSHKNENTIKTYATKCPESKKREMYDALSETIVPKRARKVETQASATVSKPPENNDFPTINIEDEQALAALDGDQNQNMNNNNQGSQRILSYNHLKQMMMTFSWITYARTLCKMNRRRMWPKTPQWWIILWQHQCQLCQRCIFLNQMSLLTIISTSKFSKKNLKDKFWNENDAIS